MRTTIGVCCAVLIAGGCTDAGEPAYEFTEIDVPGAETTTAAGINTAGEIVGWYRSGDRVHGFIYRERAYTTIDYPDAILTQLYGIGDDGEIVGGYRPAGERLPAFRGFRLTAGGEFIDVAHPQHVNSMANRRLANGTIVGCYHDGDMRESMRAVEFSNGAIAVLDTAGGMHMGGTPDGRVLVGVNTLAGRAYRIDDGVFSYLDVPGATSSEARDINRSGVITGLFVDSASVTRGFVLENGRYTVLDAPGARATAAFGLNDHGHVVGGFEVSEGVRRGFVARRAGASGRDRAPPGAGFSRAVSRAGRRSSGRASPRARRAEGRRPSAPHGERP